MADNYEALKARGFSDAEIEGLAVPELLECMTSWNER
jgi:hypothetical protein